MSGWLNHFSESASTDLRMRFAEDCLRRALRNLEKSLLSSVEWLKGQEDYESSDFVLRELRAFRNVWKDWSTFWKIRELEEFLHRAARDLAPHVLESTSETLSSVSDLTSQVAQGYILPLDVSMVAIEIAFSGSGEDTEAWDEEEEAQRKWVERNWRAKSPLGRDILAAVDDYIANGLLLRDDE